MDLNNAKSIREAPTYRPRRTYRDLDGPFVTVTPPIDVAIWPKNQLSPLCLHNVAECLCIPNRDRVSQWRQWGRHSPHHRHKFWSLALCLEYYWCSILLMLNITDESSRSRPRVTFIIKYHLIISDSTMWKRLQNVYSQSNKSDQSHWVSPYDKHLLCTLSPTNLLPTVGYLRFLYASSSSA